MITRVATALALCMVCSGLPLSSLVNGPDEHDFKRGERVTLKGLAADGDHNGQSAEVVFAHNVGGKRAYRILVDGGTTFDVRENNLERTAASAEAKVKTTSAVQKVPENALAETREAVLISHGDILTIAGLTGDTEMNGRKVTADFHHEIDGQSSWRVKLEDGEQFDVHTANLEKEAPVISLNGDDLVGQTMQIRGLTKMGEFNAKRGVMVKDDVVMGIKMATLNVDGELFQVPHKNLIPVGPGWKEEAAKAWAEKAIAEAKTAKVEQDILSRETAQREAAEAAEAEAKAAADAAKAKGKAEEEASMAAAAAEEEAKAAASKEALALEQQPEQIPVTISVDANLMGQEVQLRRLSGLMGSYNTKRGKMVEETVEDGLKIGTINVDGQLIKVGLEYLAPAAPAWNKEAIKAWSDKAIEDAKVTREEIKQRKLLEDELESIKTQQLKDEIDAAKKLASLEEERQKVLLEAKEEDLRMAKDTTSKIGMETGMSQQAEAVHEAVPEAVVASSATVGAQGTIVGLVDSAEVNGRRVVVDEITEDGKLIINLDGEKVNLRPENFEQDKEQGAHAEVVAGGAGATNAHMPLGSDGLVGQAVVIEGLASNSVYNGQEAEVVEDGDRYATVKIGSDSEVFRVKYENLVPKGQSWTEEEKAAWSSKAASAAAASAEEGPTLSEIEKAKAVLEAAAKAAERSQQEAEVAESLVADAKTQMAAEEQKLEAADAERISLLEANEATRVAKLEADLVAEDKQRIQALEAKMEKEDTAKVDKLMADLKAKETEAFESMKERLEKEAERNLQVLEARARKQEEEQRHTELKYEIEAQQETERQAKDLGKMMERHREQMADELTALESAVGNADAKKWLGLVQKNSKKDKIDMVEKQKLKEKAPPMASKLAQEAATAGVKEAVEERLGYKSKYAERRAQAEQDKFEAGLHDARATGGMKEKRRMMQQRDLM